MADELRISSRPSLTRPLMIVAFRGWNDGGQGASLAGGYLAKTWDADRFAEIEPEDFFDFQATHPKLMEEMGLEPSRYEGPTGIVGILHDAARRDKLPSVSLWAAVPHYVSLAPSPRAALALCQRLGELIGAPVDTAELEEAVE